MFIWYQCKHTQQSLLSLPCYWDMVDNYQTMFRKKCNGKTNIHTHTESIDTYSLIPRPCRRRKSGLVCTIHPCVTNTMLFFFWFCPSLYYCSFHQYGQRCGQKGLKNLVVRILLSSFISGIKIHCHSAIKYVPHINLQHYMYVQCANRSGTPTSMHAQGYIWQQPGCTGTVVNCVGLPVQSVGLWT